MNQEHSHGIPTKVKMLQDILNEDQQAKAYEILKSLHGLKLSQAMPILDFCREAVKNVAIITTDK